MKTRIRIQGILILVAFVLFILFIRLTIPSWQNEPLEEFFDVLGILLVLFGFLLRITARGYKEEMSQGGNRLVIDGPYLLIRNPMYFGTLMIGTGLVLVLFRLWTLPVFLIVYLAIYIPQITKEEKVLSARFGEEYKAYCRIASKYFINPFKVFNPSIVRLKLKTYWFKKELPSFLATISLIFIIEIWQDVKLFGYEELSGEVFELFLIVAIFVVIVAILTHLQSEKNISGK